MSLGFAEPEWLVVVDMQHVFADADSQWCTPGLAGIVEPNRRLVDHFGDRVLFTRFVAPPEPRGVWVDYYARWPFALVDSRDRLYDLVDDLPHAGRPVVSRPTFGKWDTHPGSIDEVTGGSRRLALTGVSTDCCVLSTALAAADAGVAIRVVADACAGLSEHDHQRALDAMALYAPLIEITTADALLP